jgi:hypothetical protein
MINELKRQLFGIEKKKTKKPRKRHRKPQTLRPRGESWAEYEHRKAMKESEEAYGRLVADLFY